MQIFSANSTGKLTAPLTGGMEMHRRKGRHNAVALLRHGKPQFSLTFANSVLCYLALEPPIANGKSVRKPKDIFGALLRVAGQRDIWRETLVRRRCLLRPLHPWPSFWV
jgi:hypothetical protein